MERITLATLPTATAQQVFEQVANHLLAQNARSIMGDRKYESCAYRGNDGMMCAAGCLIGDDEYNPLWEDKNWMALAKPLDEQDEDDIKRGFPGVSAHIDLIQDLQVVHDRCDVDRWREELIRVAQRRDLDASFLVPAPEVSA